MCEKPTYEELEKRCSQLEQELTWLREREDIQKGRNVRNRTVMEDLTELICRIKTDGSITFINEVFSRFFYADREFIGTKWQDVAHPADVPLVEERLSRISPDNPIQIIENRVFSGRGDIRWMQFVNRGLFDEEGVLREIQAVGRDITERVETQQALAESENRYRTLFQNMAQGVFYQRPDGALFDPNPALLDMFGVSADEFLNRHALDSRWKVIREDGSEYPLEELPSTLALKTGKPVRNVIGGLFNPRIQDYMWFSVNAIPEFREGESDPFRVAVTIHDVTLQKRSGTALARERKMLEMVIEGTRAGTWEWHIQTGKTVFNERWAEMLGYTLEELQPVSIRTWTDLCHPDDLRRSNQLLEAHFAGTVPYYECECRLRRQSGEWIWVKDRGKVVQWTEEGTPLLMVGTHLDITERKRAEASLRENERRYRLLFEESPISLWEEDLSGVKAFFDDLRHSGVNDFRRYLEEHPEAVDRCVSLIKVIAVNKATVALFEADSEKDILDGLSAAFLDETYPVFRDNLVALATGETTFESEAVARTLKGAVKYVALRWTVVPGCENTLSKVLVSVLDITERRRAEEELARMFSMSLDLICIADIQTMRFLKVNPAFTEVLGYPEHELIERSFLDLMHPDDVDSSLSVIENDLQTGIKAIDFHNRYRCKDGTYRWLSWHSQPNPDKGITYAIARDITAWKQMEMERQHTLDLLKNAEKIGKTGSWARDLRTGREEWSDGIFLIHGLPVQRPASPEWHLQKMHPEDRTVHYRLFKENLLSDKTRFSQEYRIQLEDQGVRHIRFDYAVDRDPDGRPLHVHGTAKDVTEFRQAEAQLRLHSLIFEQIRDVVVVTDLDGAVTSVNQSAAKLLGCSPENLVGRFVDAFGENPDRGATQKDILEETLANGYWRGEVTNRTADGREIIMDCRTQIVHDEKGQPVALCGIANDITYIKEAESALQRRDRILQAVNFEAEQFIRAQTLRGETVVKVLGRLGEAARVSRVCIIQNRISEGGDVCMNLRYEWLAPGIPAQAGNADSLDISYAAAGFDRWMEALKGGNCISGNAKDLPSPERGMLFKQGIQSILAVPLFVERQWWGYMCFDDRLAEREWLPMEVDALKTAASILGLSIERKHAEETITASLREKEVLLREIHHRIKNNMQVTSSLLNLQAKRINDPKLIEVFRESENRIRTMALVHDKLYLSDNISNIRFKEYVEDLVRNQVLSYGFETNELSIDIDIEDILFEIDIATPCGIIISELVSNALKYAFPEGGKGRIGIALKARNHNMVELRVKDDGVGLPEDLDIGRTTHFGLYMVKLLAEGQLGGRMEVLRKGGAEYRIDFKMPTYSM